MRLIGLHSSSDVGFKISSLQLVAVVAVVAVVVVVVVVVGIFNGDQIICEVYV